MIIQFINFLKNDLSLFIKNSRGKDDDLVIFANLNAVIESGADTNKLVISIVNIEEDRILKNAEPFAKNRTETHYKSPDVSINLTCLFTYYNKNDSSYEGIELLENVIQYFQSNPTLNISTASDIEDSSDKFQRIHAELQSLDFEQTNQLWNLFGGIYYPSVVYKFRGIKITNE